MLWVHRLLSDSAYLSLMKEIIPLKRECALIVSQLGGSGKYSLNPNFIYHSSLHEKKTPSEVKLLERLDFNFSELLKRVDSLSKVVYSISGKKVITPILSLQRNFVDVEKFSYVYYTLNGETFDSPLFITSAGKIDWNGCFSPG